MLCEFLTENRDEIIARTREKVAARAAPRATEAELENGVPMFLSQLVEALRRSPASSDEMNRSATTHGGELLRLGFTVAQVVHDYGDVCQAVTELAIERKAPISVEEFRTLNRCVDDATADAVTEYERGREQQAGALENERMGSFAHELRNRLNSAMLAFDVIKAGNITASGSTGAVVERSLKGLNELIERSLTEARLEAGSPKRSRVLLAEILEEIEVAATIEAHARRVRLLVAPVAYGVAVEVDRHLLSSAVTNLLQNAFKFTRPGGQVSVKTEVFPDRVAIAVEDECGGLPPGKAEELFRPYEQRGADRSGLGLGLSISRRAVEANGGTIHVRNVSGKGCVFTIELPRLALKDVPPKGVRR